jgi:hypothetical protein
MLKKCQMAYENMAWIITRFRSEVGLNLENFISEKFSFNNQVIEDFLSNL